MFGMPKQKHNRDKMLIAPASSQFCSKLNISSSLFST